jgi:hypothetical protein
MYMHLTAYCPLLTYSSDHRTELTSPTHRF